MVAACFIAGAIAYPLLPSAALSHWNAAGQADGTMPAFLAAFLMPAIMLVLWGVWALLPRIDPIAPGFKGFRHVYDFFWILVSAFLAYVYALTLMENLVRGFDLIIALAPALAALFFMIGSLLPLMKRNWFVGIRTPWSLSSDAVWDRTHRVGGKLFELAGIIILFGYLYPHHAVWLIVLPTITAALVSVTYSYFLFAREKKGS